MRAPHRHSGRRISRRPRRDTDGHGQFLIRPARPLTARPARRVGPAERMGRRQNSPRARENGTAQARHRVVGTAGRAPAGRARQVHDVPPRPVQPQVAVALPGIPHGPSLPDVRRRGPPRGTAAPTSRSTHRRARARTRSSRRAARLPDASPTAPPGTPPTTGPRPSPDLSRSRRRATTTAHRRRPPQRASCGRQPLDVVFTPTGTCPARTAPAGLRRLAVPAGWKRCGLRGWSALSPRVYR